MENTVMLQNYPVPKTKNGKILQLLVHEIPRDMDAVISENLNWLILKTTSVAEFGVKLVQNGQLSSPSFIQAHNLAKNQSREMYRQVAERGNWGGLIRALEESNDHIVAELSNRLIRKHQKFGSPEWFVCLQNDDNSLHEKEKANTTNLEALEACNNSQVSQNINNESSKLRTSKGTPDNPRTVLTRKLLREKELSRKLLFGAIATLVAVVLCFGLLYRMHTHMVPKQVPSEINLIARKDASSVLEVTSANDFENLKGKENVVISNLEISSPFPQYLSAESHLEYMTVKNLTVSGGVSEKWLEYIISSFRNLQHLTIDMTAICFSATMKNISTYNPLVLENCESFQVLNSNNCYLESWIYRWQFPRLTNIIFKNVQINRRNCKNVNRLLKNNGGSYINAVFLDCNIYNCILETHGESGGYNITIAKASIPTEY
ncbi:unnamed protein product [Allacma fusca]|uniref:Uncharacterized protein n=1 Tax=Allacma fusca TaxID=39272 RepID=A0A8J2K5R4_9HEXA|nr:unnamed protein product [Allacma fusca]